MTVESMRTQPRPPSAIRFVLVALIVPAILLLWYTWLRSEYAVTERTRATVERSFRRRLSSVVLLSSLREAESAQRGYVLTGNADYLTPYQPAKLQTLRAMRALERDPGSDELAQRVEALAALALDRFAEMDRTIAARQRGELDVAMTIVSSDAGRLLMQLAVTRANAVLQSEQRLLDAHIDRYARTMVATRRVILASIVAATLLLFAVLLIFWTIRNARYRARLAAYEAGERSQAILASAHDALLILNSSGTIDQVNAATTAMLGYRADELVRRDIDAIVPITRGEGSFFQRLGVVGGQLRQPLLHERDARHRDGQTIPVDVALSVMELPSGTYVIVSLRDISEQKRLDRVKDELVSTISHELRTPLTSVVGALGLLRARVADDLPPEANRLIEISDNNARRLIRLVNDMLDLDRVSAGLLPVQRQPTDLREAVARACEGSETLGTARKVHIECSLPPLSVMVSGDNDRLVQVVTNLLSNAVRVSPDGGTVRVAMTFDDGREAVVTVDDDGPGIPAGFRNRIFGRFERARNSDTSTGAGLGLAISRAIIEAHDGRIWFEDRAQGGTRFVFALPTRHPPEPLTPDGPARLLVCAGDPDLRQRLVDLFTADRYQVDCVADAALARGALDRHRYDALLIELRLPDESALLLARDLRRADGASRVPIIVLADGDSETLSARGALDVVDWIAKPVDKARLSAAVMTAVARSGSKRPVVLHLDDDEDILEVTATMLRPDATVLKASTLAEARALLDENTPDAAILDAKLAEESGLDLLPMLIDADGHAIPTIIFSAQDVTPAMARSVSAVLVKSRKSLPDLRATLRRLLRPASAAGDQP